MNEYRVDAYNASGVLQGILTDFLGMSYTKIVNDAGILLLDFSSSHPLMGSLADKWQFEVWRRPEGGSWAQDFVGIYRDPTWSYGEAGPRVNLVCPGILSMLGWRHVLWYADTLNRSRFTNSADETVLKTLVNYNAGPSATVVNGRLRAGSITGLTIETDSDRGNLITWYCAWDNLLKAIKDIVKIGDGDIDLIKTSPTTYNFRYYANQRGTDKSSTLLFAMERGNMANPIYKINRSGEKTVALVGGKGEGSDRETVIRTGYNYNVTTNNIEMFVNATDVSAGDTAGLNAKGDAELSKVTAVEEFTFDVIEVPSTRYMVDFSFGDRGVAINPFTGSIYTVVNKSVTVTLKEDGSEVVKPVFVQMTRT